jgi:nucleotide-binding universal stress UspA family protein
MPKTLIVPVDGSESAERAVQVALLLIERFDRCAMVVMMASGYDDRGGRRYLDALVKHLDRRELRTEFVDNVDAADAIALLTDVEPDAVVCMATHGRGRLAAPFLGSVATEVLQRVATPVMLIGPHSETAWWHDPPRVVTCRAGEGFDPILPYAKEWAERLSAEFWLESVFHPLDTRMAANPHAEFEPALEQLRTDVDVHLLPLRSDYPAGAIVQSAHDLPATLLAMTTHARTGIARAVLGSVAMDVVHRSPCPVLVMHHS